MENELLKILTIIAVLSLIINIALDCTIDDRKMNLHLGYSILSILGLYNIGEYVLSLCILIASILWSILWIIMYLSRNEK